MPPGTIITNREPHIPPLRVLPLTDGRGDGWALAARYKKIDPRIWDDEKFSELSPGLKLITFHAITAQSNRCGIFSFSVARAIEQTGAVSDSYAIGFKKVCDTYSWRYDSRRRVLYIPTWWKYNPPENPKHLIGCLADLHDLPQTELLNDFAKNTRYLYEPCLSTFQERIDRYLIAMPIGIGYQEQEQKHKQEQNLLSSQPNENGNGLDEKKPKAKRAPKDRILTPEQIKIRDSFSEWWRDHAWPAAHHGVMCEFKSDSAAAVLEIMRSRNIGWDEAKARRLAEFYLTQPVEYGAQGHPLRFLGLRLGYYADRMIGGNGASNGKRHPTAAERGEFAEPDRKLPEF
jgi:hypothetical protein